ncbi:MAG: hypothetical protein ACREDR_14695 [Blastocatellia bacterium]
MADISKLKGKIDFGIITIREDEFAAVLQRFPKHASVTGRRIYAVSWVATNNGDEYSIAMVRCPEPGNGQGQSVASDMIEDLDPQWLVVIGIAGGVPADEYTLGDVVAAQRLSDFTVAADIEDEHGRRQDFAMTGGPMHKKVQSLLAHLPAMAQELGDWNKQNSIGQPTPPVRMGKKDFYGDDSWQQRVRESLRSHFQKNHRPPRVTTGNVASSDHLIKDSVQLREWRHAQRQLIAIEMELAGVYQAARQTDREYPILAVRGISDIVGYRRDPRWTAYACQTASSFALALIKTRPIAPRSQQVPLAERIRDSSAVVQPQTARFGDIGQVSGFVARLFEDDFGYSSFLISYSHLSECLHISLVSRGATEIEMQREILAIAAQLDFDAPMITRLRISLQKASPVSDSFEEFYSVFISCEVDLQSIRRFVKGEIDARGLWERVTFTIPEKIGTAEAKVVEVKVNYMAAL